MDGRGIGHSFGKYIARGASDAWWGKRIAAVSCGCLQPAISGINDLGHRTGSLQYPCGRKVVTI